jgi:hypothetical protein
VTGQPTHHVAWEHANRDALMAELHVVRCWLRAHGGVGTADADTIAEAHLALDAARARLPRPSALDEVARGFALTSFERSLLLLAAAPELAAETSAEIDAAGGGSRPTFGLALAALPDAHWGALTPRAPLRHWRLLHLLDPTTPTHSPLVPDERVLHHLLGAGYLDPDLAALARTLEPLPDLPPTLHTATARMVEQWQSGRLVVLAGPQQGNLAPVAAAAASRLGRVLHVVDAADVPTEPEPRGRFARLLEREAVLGGSAWALDATRATEVGSLLRRVQDLDAPAVVLVDGEVPALPDSAVVVVVPRVPVVERRATLLTVLADQVLAEADEATAHAAATVFDLAVPDVHRAVREAATGRPLWQAYRSRAAARFDGLAQVIEPRATWDDLVLPEPQLQQLRALVAAVRHRATVLDDWGFADRSARGLGTAALFAGASGTGKTLAAEVIATTLGLDLVVVDLSQVVSKYIGETEKNLRRVFEAAEDSAAVLLFDEADTLFGKRTEIRDSHDRYANLEVGYLLSRIESFRGLAVLTTNAKSVLDQAFLRRLRFIVSFPYPDPAARERMWRLAFPSAVPTTGIDPARLATIDLPGGGIAAAALTAAYLGAGRGVVTADDVAAATKWEMAKLGRSVAGR